ncbi:hypothetical protein AV521_45425 [Streptomyces sp. IMTB 2501]|nr:hypothetical protein AV521_45425 [Streptomyces sp. IMTB 2501]
MYCAVVLETFSRRVVGWSIDASPTAALTTHALAMAIGNRSPRPGGTVIHSDHGAQFGSWAFHPAREGLRPSAFGGLHRGLRGQRDDGILLGPGPGRTAQPQTVADASRAVHGPGRVPGDLPWPTT